MAGLIYRAAQMSVCGYGYTLFISQFPPHKQQTQKRGKGQSFGHRRLFNFSAISSTSIETHNSIPVSVKALASIVLSRRLLGISVLAASLLPSCSEAIEGGGGREELELERYTDPKDGFTFLRPSSWIKVDKAGATVLFEDSSKGSNNVGVVVSPVKITGLSQFGTPQFVAEKLIQAERRKESTVGAELVAVSERLGKGGIEVYEFEYKVDSSRGGMKRVFSAAFVLSKKLYLLNITHSDGLENPLDPDTRKVLEEVLHSFDVDQHQYAFFCSPDSSCLPLVV
ncbi:PREDICTED: psbP domain-containing protein 2, chloroplastic [Ipomoea nil]|uniref:psbP domain-containing protein 2, chloroplastic n=1 Tax=Ipomoea nil TaxID=35883 RepID=UPI000901328C|nr:PREDICTED: psbP domain-containing protein 2, chloroplastic [Ipomoea nil]XP_019177229.1 PREDICTED: psbP domain-containing protein 2, chloroplastic [Ipomoea nil]